MLSSDFHFWFREGIHHILSFSALDHMLFITALCITHSFRRWRQTLLLITAFTIGHSITLAGVALGYIQVNTRWVEFAIPLTIAATALQQILRGTGSRNVGAWLYASALFFGFIHGMAYGAAQIGSLYSRNEAIPLVLAFNLGIETGQLVVVAAVLLLGWLLTRLLKIPERYWQVFLSSCIFVYAIFLAVKNFPAHTRKNEMAFVPGSARNQRPGLLQPINTHP